LTVADVEEVVREFANEAVVSRKSMLSDDDGDGANGNVALLGDEAQIDLSTMNLDPRLAKGINRQIDALGADQFMDQLQRLERSVLRLERMNVETLGVLKKLVNAVKKTSTEAAK
jgi:hypothetical protein